MCNRFLESWVKEISGPNYEKKGRGRVQFRSAKRRACYQTNPLLAAAMTIFAMAADDSSYQRRVAAGQEIRLFRCVLDLLFKPGNHAANHGKIV